MYSNLSNQTRVLLVLINVNFLSLERVTQCVQWPPRHFLAFLHIIKFIYCYKLLVLLFTVYRSYLPFIINFKLNFIPNVCDARLAPASVPTVVTPSHTWVSCPFGTCQNCQRGLSKLSMPPLINGSLASSQLVSDGPRRRLTVGRRGWVGGRRRRGRSPFSRQRSRGTLAFRGSSRRGPRRR